MADIRNIHRLRFISVDEEYLFPKISDVINSCFGKTWGGYYKPFIPLNDGSDYVVWFPKMAKKRGDKFIPLIPMAFQNQFDVSLDVEENVVSLCSNCHNEIHYGRDADTLIRILYSERKAVLEKAGIMISMDDLQEIYGY